MSELWIIEAPGKAQTLEGILTEMGIDAKVQATKGHLMSMPDKLTPMGIDQNFHEFAREPKFPHIYKRIQQMAGEASSVIIATDADSEGDVIAWDVAEAISLITTNVMRVKLRGMDEESIREAIRLARPVSKEDAIPGRTRAIIDRMIGGVYSHNGVAVGRVSTAMLGVISKKKPSVLQLRLSAPSKDGGRPWLTQCPVVAPLTEGLARRLEELDFPMLDMKSQSSFTAAPGNMGDIMVRAADNLDMSPVETARSMQRSYEIGQLSYPRAGSHSMGRAVVNKMKKIFSAHGYKFDANNVVEKDEKEVHDSPYPIGKININLDPKKLGGDEGVRTMIARDLVKSGQKHTREKANTSRIEAFLIENGFSPEVARHISGLDWYRDNGPRYPGQDLWTKNEVVRRRPDAVVLETMLDCGLGRPSTWANHVESFLARGLVDDNLTLTKKGQEWLQSSPKEFLNPKLSVAIEKACDFNSPELYSQEGMEPWENLARKIISAMPPSIGNALKESIAHEDPRPRVDYRNAFPDMPKEGFDFNAAKDPSMEYRMEIEG